MSFIAINARRLTHFQIRLSYRATVLQRQHICYMNAAISGAVVRPQAVTKAKFDLWNVMNASYSNHTISCQAYYGLHGFENATAVLRLMTNVHVFIDLYR